MIYGYVAIDSYIYNNWDTDYQDTAVADVKKVRLFLNENERDASAEAERVKRVISDLKLRNLQQSQIKVNLKLYHIRNTIIW